MKLSELLTLLATIVGTGVAVAALTLDVVGDLRTEVRQDIRALREAQARTESRVAHIEGQLVHLNLVRKTAEVTPVDPSAAPPLE